VRWFTLAAEQDNAQAQHQLGVCYVRGLGVDRDLTKAGEWFKRAHSRERTALARENPAHAG
jgi:TPR repeat protein